MAGSTEAIPDRRGEEAGVGLEWRERESTTGAQWARGRQKLVKMLAPTKVGGRPPQKESGLYFKCNSRPFWMWDVDWMTGPFRWKEKVH